MELTVDIVGLSFCLLLHSPFRQSLLAGCDDIHQKAGRGGKAQLLRLSLQGELMYVIVVTSRPWPV